MAKRKAYAPFSLTSEAGVAQTPVEGYIDVEQKIYPTVSTGTINENGKWAGVKSDDTEFFAITTALAIPNGGEFLAPDTADHPSLDMTGFRDLFIAFKVTEGGGSGYAITAVMGPDTERFANLSPINPASTLRGNQSQSSPADFEDIFKETQQVMTQDVWNIFSINDVLRNQKNMQFKITNNTGAQTDAEVAFMRLI
tara:strand:- start:168 stop:758 length:591 start_codon:yes stop_codon:yes gene_type:complete